MTYYVNKQSYLFFRIVASILIIASLAALDIYSKKMLFDFLKQQQNNLFILHKYCSLVSVWNYGISFGMFTKYQQYSNIIFLILNSLIVIYLYYLLIISNSKLSFLGFNLVVGGAIGNIIDRIINGAVFDFIYLHYHDYDFAVFNFADSFISIGVVLLILDYYLTKKYVARMDS